MQEKRLFKLGTSKVHANSPVFVILDSMDEKNFDGVGVTDSTMAGISPEQLIGEDSIPAA